MLESLIQKLDGRTVFCHLVFESQAPPYFPFHSHTALELVHHLGGSGITHVETGQTFEYQCFDVVMYPAGVRHDQEAHKTGSDLCVLIGLPDDIVPPKQALYFPPITETHLREELLALLQYRPLPSPLQQTMYNHAITAILLRLALQQNSAKSDDTHYAEAAARHLHTHFSSIQRVDEIADRLNISPDHLRHVFKQRFGISLHQRLVNLRIAQAKNLLAFSLLPVKQVARMCGYSNERYFAYGFRKEVKMTPGEYRKMQNKLSHQ